MPTTRRSTSFELLPDNGNIHLRSRPGKLLEYFLNTCQFFDDEDSYANALNAVTNDPLNTDRIVRHETQHLTVAKQVGVEMAKYTLQLDTVGKLKEVSISMWGGDIPKLAVAAIFAAPVDPSESDKADITRLGYEGIEDIGDRVIEWNRNNSGVHIPVPFSYRLQDGTSQNIAAR